MSIALHCGRLVEMEVGDAHQAFLRSRPAIAEISRRLAATEIAGRAAGLIDDAAIDGKCVDHPLATAWDQVDREAREIRVTGCRRPLADFSIELWLFPMPGRTLVYVNTERPELLAAIDEHDWVKDHSYWDSTDRDPGVPEGEWARRRMDWKQALPPGARPSERCLTMTVTGLDVPSFDADEILTVMPSSDWRISRLARQRHFQQLVDAHGDQNEKTSMADMMRLMAMADRDPETRSTIAEAVSAYVTPINRTRLLGH